MQGAFEYVGDELGRTDRTSALGIHKAEGDVAGNQQRCLAGPAHLVVDPGSRSRDVRHEHGNFKQVVVGGGAAVLEGEVR